jgi:hypothetical protein
MIYIKSGFAGQDKFQALRIILFAHGFHDLDQMALSPELLHIAILKVAKA